MGWQVSFALNQMKKAITFLIFAIYLNSCDLFDRSCTCTEMECFEGIKVALINNPDSLLYHSFDLSISYSDTVESTSELWGRYYEEVFMFSSYKLRKERPDQIQIILDYVSPIGPVYSSISQAVEWEQFVCNECSGNRKSCKDDDNYSAFIELDLASIIVQ